MGSASPIVHGNQIEAWSESGLVSPVPGKTLPADCDSADLRLSADSRPSLRLVHPFHILLPNIALTWL